MLYREIIVICSEIHIKHINKLCGKNVEFVIIKPAGAQSEYWASKPLWQKIYATDVLSKQGIVINTKCFCMQWLINTLSSSDRNDEFIRRSGRGLTKASIPPFVYSNSLSLEKCASTRSLSWDLKSGHDEYKDIWIEITDVTFPSKKRGIVGSMLYAMSARQRHSLLPSTESVLYAWRICHSRRLTKTKINGRIFSHNLRWHIAFRNFHVNAISLKMCYFFVGLSHKNFTYFLQLHQMAAVNGVRTMEYFEFKKFPIHIRDILLGISSCLDTFWRQPYLLFSPCPAFWGRKNELRSKNIRTEKSSFYLKKKIYC